MREQTPALRGGLAVASVFFLVAIVLAGVLPLWLDEIIQLHQTRDSTPAQLITSLPSYPGAAPLGYLFQQAIFRAAGYSVRLARFPSVLFSSGAVFLVALLGADLGLKRGWIGSALFAIFPVTLKYACESRIYSQGLFFSLLGTILVARLAKRPSWRGAVLYCLALTLAIYSQPYAIFVGFAHVLWAVICGNRRAAAYSAVAIALAIFAFLPWYLWTKANWSAGLEGAGIHFLYSLKTPSMLFRELAGAGYWGSGLLAILFANAMFRRGPDTRPLVFLLLLIGVPVVSALAADAVSGYFVASRQIIGVLPAVAILGAWCIERSARPGLAIAVLFTAICIWQSVKFFTAPRENWQIAANALSGEVRRGACLVVVPAEELRSYVFFRPELASASCSAPRMVVAFTPYATAAQRRIAVSALNSEGYSRQYGSEAGKSEIMLFAR